MIVLEPLTMERIWGGKLLYDYSADPAVENVGAVNSVYCSKEMSNNVLKSPYKEEKFYDLYVNNIKDFGVSKGTVFPFIIAFTHAGENLSVQVHPDDQAAKEKADLPIGKSESWYFIEEPQDGWIYSGSLEKDKDKIRKSMDAGQVDDVVGKLTVEKGDLVYVPSGTLHALTKGALVYEIQQSTDITYRFYDYDRLDKNGNKRELHLEDAIDCLHPEQVPDKVKFNLGDSSEQKPYTLDYVKLAEKYANKNDVFQVLSPLEDVIINGYKVNKGTSVIVMPNEELVVDKTGEAIIATPHIYWI